MPLKQPHQELPNNIHAHKQITSLVLTHILAKHTIEFLYFFTPLLHHPVFNILHLIQIHIHVIFTFKLVYILDSQQYYNE